MTTEIATQPKIKVKMQRKPKQPGFKTFRLKIEVDADGNEEKKIEFHTEKLLSFLRDNTNIEDIYDDVPVVDFYELFNHLDQIKHRAQRYDKTGATTELVAFLESENSTLLSRIKNMMEKGVMSFGLIKTLFSPGTEIEIHDEELFGARVLDSEYRSGMFSGPYLNINYEFISTDGRNFTRCRSNIRVSYWKGTKDIDKMPIRPLSEDIKTKLVERGKLYSAIGVGSHYMNFRGQMMVKKWWSWDPMRADGRIMADSSTYDQFTDSDYNSDDRSHDEILSEISEDHLWMTDPYIKGFSF